MRQLVTGFILLTLTAAPARSPETEPWSAPQLVRSAEQDSAFAKLVARLSEPGGFFDSDNLISNETSYLHVIGAMREMGVKGGAYIGVGPDQSFSYIAQIRPKVAIMVDIRRDNLLQHLLFKALFALSRNRIEYLSLLVGRTPPSDGTGWDARSVEEIVAFVDAAGARKDLQSARALLDARVKSFGIALDETDLSTIRAIHDAFIGLGLDLRFTSAGRPPRDYYPTLRELLLAQDLNGKQSNYLASEEAFQFLRSMEAKDLIVPVVGNLGGQQALGEIARYIAERGETVSAFYASNVEFYLMRDGSFDQFAENVKKLPRDKKSVLIRSYFGGPWRQPHPQNVPGFFSTQLLQTMDSFVAEYDAGGYQGYWDLVTKHSLPLTNAR